MPEKCYVGGYIRQISRGSSSTVYRMTVRDTASAAICNNRAVTAGESLFKLLPECSV